MRAFLQENMIFNKQTASIYLKYNVQPTRNRDTRTQKILPFLLYI